MIVASSSTATAAGGRILVCRLLKLIIIVVISIQQFCVRRSNLIICSIFVVLYFDFQFIMFVGKPRNSSICIII